MTPPEPAPAAGGWMYGRSIRPRLWPSAFQSGTSASARLIAASSDSPCARARSKVASSCMASSSTISASRSAATLSGGRCSRTYVCQFINHQLRVSDFGDLIERVDELSPHATPGAQHLAAGRRQAIKTAAAFARLFHPAAHHPPLFFQLVQQGIQRRCLEAQLAAGPRFDDLCELVAVAIGTVKDRQHQELGAALLKRSGGDIRHIDMKHIYLTATGQQPLASRDLRSEERRVGKECRPGW